MKVTTKGQVTIPIEVRLKLGILPNTEVDFVVRGNSVYLVKAEPKKNGNDRGSDLIARLRGKGTANRDMSTDEILALMRG